MGMFQSLILASLLPALTLFGAGEKDFKEAKTDVSIGYYHLAVVHLERLLKEYPGSRHRSEMLMLLVKSYIATHREKEAIPHLRTLVQDYPEEAAKLEPSVRQLLQPAAPEQSAVPVPPPVPRPKPATAMPPAPVAPKPATTENTAAAPASHPAADRQTETAVTPQPLATEKAASVPPAPAAITPTEMTAEPPTIKAVPPSPPAVQETVTSTNKDVPAPIEKATTAPVEKIEAPPVVPAAAPSAVAEAAPVAIKTDVPAPSPSQPAAKSETALPRKEAEPPSADIPPTTAPAVANKAATGHYALFARETAYRTRLAKILKQLRAAGLQPTVHTGKKSVVMHRLVAGCDSTYEAAQKRRKNIAAVSKGAFIFREGGNVCTAADSFKTIEVAEYERKRLAGKGYTTRTVAIPLPITHWNVSAGTFSNTAAAEEMQRRLAGNGLQTVIQPITDEAGTGGCRGDGF